MKKATAAEMRLIEQMAVERGDTYDGLMERAGTAAADWIAANPELTGLPVTVVCGRGNNGGDGFVIARQLCATADVTVVLALGSHREHTAEEQKKLVGEEVYRAVPEFREPPDAFYAIAFRQSG